MDGEEGKGRGRKGKKRNVKFKKYPHSAVLR